MEPNQPINNHPVESQIVVPPINQNPPKSHRSKYFLIVFIVLILLCATGASAYYLGALKTKNSPAPVIEKQANEISKVPTTSPTPQSSLFSGTLEKISDLQIFKLTEEDKLNSWDTNAVYYQAGVFEKGTLKGYTRIIAMRGNTGPGGPIAFILATKDFKSYVLNDENNSAIKYVETDYDSPYYYLDKSKITSTQVFDTEYLEQLTLNSSFSLYKDQIANEFIQTNRKDKQGNTIYEPNLINYSSYLNLRSPFNSLELFAKPYSISDLNLNQLSQSEKQKYQLKQKYFLTDTKVIVVDSTGLPFLYSLTTPANAEKYKKDYANFQIALEKYKQETKNKNEQAKYPDYVYLANLGFDKNDINSSGNNVFFNVYRTAIPDACATSLETRVVNLDDTDLDKIGSVNSVSLYKLKDNNHPLYSLAYSNKLDYYNQNAGINPDEWTQVNPGVKKPTLEEYVAENPLLFIKDFWGRWVALGEFDIKLPGGCGKPVIYLYPNKPTNVSVKFNVPIQFTTDIPTYGDFWNVNAYPDGTLVNLKANLTDCDKIDDKQKGSEYAKQACFNNKYPYLYWSGNIDSNPYPEIKDGWIVKKSDLSSFLKNKLTEIGLNKNERKDFLDYWVPELLAKNGNYYRISFLQTNELNLLFPMTVNPAPTTVFRVFLDYDALTNKPDKSPNPETLDKLIRNGFTLVEWGGIKK